MDGSGINILKETPYKQALIGFIIGCLVAVIVRSFGVDKFHNKLITTVDATTPDPSNTEEFIVAELSGAVNNPGVYELNLGDRVIDLLYRGEGYLTDASEVWITNNINGAEILSDQQKIYIPFEWEIEDISKIYLSEFPMKTPETVSSDVINGETSKPTVDIVDYTKVNVNVASLDELKSLPGVGDVYSQKIVSGRPYNSSEEFQNNSGLSSSVYEKIMDLITFN